MALTPLGADMMPTYLAESTDIVDNKIEGTGIVGGTVYLLDTGEWKIVKPDQTLAPFYMPTTPPAP